MTYLFTPSAINSLAIINSALRFPVRRIYCVGRNYAEHAKEMGHSAREAPFFFAKPADALLNVAPGDVGQMPYPAMTQNLHHEVELVVALGEGGKEISVEHAVNTIAGYAIGLDMTRRDLQTQMKQQGKPWEIGKAFDYSAPIGPLHLSAEVNLAKLLEKGEISLSVNGQARQQGNLADLIWGVPETIAYLSTLFELQPGDLIFTGTPAGVGQVVKGDLMVAKISGLGELKVTLV